MRSPETDWLLIGLFLIIGILALSIGDDDDDDSAD